VFRGSYDAFIELYQGLREATAELDPESKGWSPIYSATFTFLYFGRGAIEFTLIAAGFMPLARGKNIKSELPVPVDQLDDYCREFLGYGKPSTTKAQA
jgi:hypothetical protein